MIESSCGGKNGKLDDTIEVSALWSSSQGPRSLACRTWLESYTPKQEEPSLWYSITICQEHFNSRSKTAHLSLRRKYVSVLHYLYIK